jgi:hypothetical protein
LPSFSGPDMNKSLKRRSAVSDTVLITGASTDAGKTVTLY